MKYSNGPDMSLIEQKKLQWAKEKEELSKMNEFFSTSTATTHQFERTSIRTYYSNVDLTSSAAIGANNMPRKPKALHDQSHVYQSANAKFALEQRTGNGESLVYGIDNGHYHAIDDIDMNGLGGDALDKHYFGASMRAQMLPPIERADNRGTRMSGVQQPNANIDEDTSGYLSDSRTSPIMWAEQQPQTQRRSKNYQNYMYPSAMVDVANALNDMNIDRAAKQQMSPQPGDNDIESDFIMPKTPSSIYSDMRHYSRVPSYPPNRKDKDERAKWGHRAAHVYDNISKESSIRSTDGPCWLDKGFIDSGDESVRSYSFIRGQNAPVDPGLMAERQSRRLKALELQNAIRAQVEERERIKRMEHERALLEDRRNEDRLRQQIESNEQRAEEEQRRYREKMQREQEKQETMRVAIEKARQEAELEKAKRRMLHIQAAGDGAEHDSGCNDNDEDARQCSSDTNHSSDSAIQPNGSDESFGGKSFSTDSLIEKGYDDDIDDGDQILIGTPIKMRKKTLNRQPSKKPTAAGGAGGTPLTDGAETRPADGTTIDGIALLLQAMPPLMPITPNDIQNLNQNLNTLNSNNIQLAAMLTQQMQQLNSLANGRSSETKSDRSNECHADTARGEQAACKRCANQSNEQSTGCSPADSRVAAERVNGKAADEASDVGEEATPPIADAVMVAEQAPIGELKSRTFDASTQTEHKYGLEYCFQCRYHSCHHHHVLLKDVTQRCGDDFKTIALDQLKATCMERDCSAAHTNRPLDLKDVKELPMRLEDRPKWGVNRPQHQYIKASERDPFYLRNKRKRHSRRRPFAGEMAYDDGTAMDAMDDKEDGRSRTPSPSPSVITNSTVILSSPQVMAASSPKSKRTVCTEILPIKTDVNGRVYLNFNESNMILSEDDIKLAGKQQRNNKMHRMTNRCQTVNALQGIKGNEAKMAARSLKSADQDLLTCS